MKEILNIILIVSIISCNNNSVQDLKSNKKIDEELKLNKYPEDKTFNLEILKWVQKSVSNIEFNCPENFVCKNSNLSFQCLSNDLFSLNIDFNNITEDLNGKNIYEIIENPESFAIENTQFKKKLFSDIKLINYSFKTIGNKETFCIEQSSFDVSGKNKNIIIKSYFVISEGNYFSIVFGYEEKDFLIFEKIKNSFVFSEKDGKQVHVNTKTKPTYIETCNWLLNKFNTLVVDKKIIHNTFSGPINESIFSNYYFDIVDEELVISLKYEFIEPYLSEKGERFIEVTGLNRNDVLRMYPDGKKTTIIEKKKYKIPIRQISYLYYDETNNTEGNSTFSINTRSPLIKVSTNINNSIKYESSISFDIKSIEQDDICKRIEDAIKNLQEVLPVKKKDNELF